MQSTTDKVPIDTQARALAHHAKWMERDNPTIARILREAAERIEEQRATIDDLRKPMGTVPERE